MKKRVMTIYDKAAEMFLTPMHFRTLSEGCRTFKDMVNRDDLSLKKNAVDFVLMDLGTYDDNSGQFQNCPKGPQLLMTGLEALSEKPFDDFGSTEEQQKIPFPDTEAS